MDGIKHTKRPVRSSTSAHRTVQKSVTLNRHFVKKPSIMSRIVKDSDARRSAATRRDSLAKNQSTRSPLISRNAPPTSATRTPGRTSIDPTPPTSHPKVALAKARVQAKSAPAPRLLTAEELKERAIKKALLSAEAGTVTTIAEQQIETTISKKRRIWRSKKFVIALVTSVLAIAALGYLINLNLPDLSVRVAALASGIDSAYPSYVPQGYRLNGLASEKDGKITMTFNRGDKSFTLIEEKSSWDSAALLNNFVTDKWGDKYSIAKQRGLTIYVSGSSAAWVNGGIFYLIESSGSSLTTKQLHDIALSL